MTYAILVAVEDKKTREDTVRVLREAGHGVLDVADGTEALAKVKEQDFAVLITSLVLPGINGIELIRAVHDVRPNLEAIVLSPDGTESTRDKLARIGAFGYLEIPPNKDLIVDMAASAVRSKRTARISFGEAQPQLGFNRERILIVDDDTMIQEVLSRFLVEKGYRVTLAGNGREAYEKILVNDYDCILLDINMPEMDGVQTVRAIRKTDPNTYILLMSGEATSQDVVKAMDLGANRFMPKPIDYDMLLSWIGEVHFAEIADAKKKLYEQEKVTVKRKMSVFDRLFNPYRSKKIRRTIPYALAVIVIGILIWVISALFQVRMFKMLESSKLFDKFDSMIESVK